MAMERSRVTVEYKHLYQQVFEHEAEGVNCVVQDISGGLPEQLTLDQALDAVETPACPVARADGGLRSACDGVPRQLQAGCARSRQLGPLATGLRV